MEDPSVSKTDDQLFYTPFSENELLIKADEKDPNVIYIKASSQAPDLQKEVLFMKALEEEAESFLKSGLLSWDHLHKIKGSPEYIIGEPLDVNFKKSTNETWVKGKLYEKVGFAQHVKNLLASGCSRLGASVGGSIRRKAPMLTKALTGIMKVIWDELAITYKPVHPATLGNVSLIPIGAFAKALAVGSGVDASQFTGGRALLPESMQGVVSQVAAQTSFKELLWRMKNGTVRTSDDLRDFLAMQGLESLYTNIANTLIRKFVRR